MLYLHISTQGPGHMLWGRLLRAAFKGPSRGHRLGVCEICENRGSEQALC